MNLESTEILKSGRFTRPDLVFEVTEWMREKILSGEFPEGESLPAEGKLATQLGVSRNAMREAMRNLRTEGLIEISQGKSPKVKKVDADAAIKTLDTLLKRSQATPQDLIEVRLTLETEISALACKNANQVDIDVLEDCMQKLRASDGGEESIEADIAFHRQLAKMTKNPVFILILDTLRGLLYKSQELTFPKAGLEVAIKGHGEILNAIKGKEPSKAREAMKNHILDAGRDLNN